MKITDLVAMVNELIPAEILTPQQLVIFINFVIAEINARLNADFPLVKTDDFTTEYTAIPEKYLRTVVAPGAVWRFFVTDEEGSATAFEYKEQFYNNLFYMERDYLPILPEEYQADMRQGVLPHNPEHDIANQGVYIDGYYFFL